MNVAIYAYHTDGEYMRVKGSYYKGEPQPSIEAQLKVCRNFAKKRKYTVVGEFVDVTPDRNHKQRHQYHKMIDERDAMQIQGIVISGLGRLYIGTTDFAVRKYQLDDLGILLFAVKNNAF